MIVFVIVDGSGRAVEMTDERFAKTVVTRHGEFMGEPVTLQAWGTSPAPFLKLTRAIRVKVAQDGADFYQVDGLPGFTWRAPIRVTDHDMKAAEQARTRFLWWAADHRLSPVFEGDANG